jgi:hypothetical protein
MSSQEEIQATKNSRANASLIGPVTEPGRTPRGFTGTINEPMPLPRDIFFVPDMDPDFEYLWANSADRNMITTLGEGWELVTGAPELPEAVRQKLQGITAQSSENGGSPEEVRRRGDLVLVRMRKDLYEKRIAAPARRRQKQHDSSLDTLVEQANDSTRSMLAKAQQKSIRARTVFQSSDDDRFESEGVK